MPFSRETIVRSIIIFTCQHCKAKEEYESLNYGEVVTCKQCGRSESFTGKEQVKYDIIQGPQNGFKKILNNQWFVSIVAALLIAALIGILYIILGYTNNKL